MYDKRQWFRAILQGLWMFLTGLAVYQGVPDSLDKLWQPAIQGMLAVLGALGINLNTRERAPRDRTEPHQP